METIKNTNIDWQALIHPPEIVCWVSKFDGDGQEIQPEDLVKDGHVLLCSNYWLKLPNIRAQTPFNFSLAAGKPVIVRYDKRFVNYIVVRLATQQEAG